MRFWGSNWLTIDFFDLWSKISSVFLTAFDIFYHCSQWNTWFCMTAFDIFGICGQRTPLFPRATSQVAMLAWIFGDCREGQIPRCLQRCKFDTPLLAAGSLIVQSQAGFKAKCESCLHEWALLSWNLFGGYAKPTKCVAFWRWLWTFMKSVREDQLTMPVRVSKITG